MRIIGSLNLIKHPVMNIAKVIDNEQVETQAMQAFFLPLYCLLLFADRLKGHIVDVLCLFDMLF